MKKSMKIGFTSMALAMTLVCGNAVFAAPEDNTNYSKRWDLATDVQSIDLAATDVKGAINVEFKPSGTGTNYVEFTGVLPEAMVDRIEGTTTDGRTLKINLNKTKVNPKTSEPQVLTVYVAPGAKIRNFGLSTGTHAANVANSSAERTSVASSTGAINVWDADVNTLNIASATGKVSLANSNANVATSIATALRAVSINNLSTLFLNAATTTGLLTIENSTITNSALATSNGGIKVMNTEFKGVEAASGTGNITIDLPAEYAGKISARAYRGVTLPEEYNEEGSNVIVARTGLGKILIN